MLQRNNKVLFILKNSKNSTNGFYLMNQMIDAIDFEDYNMEVTKIKPLACLRSFSCIAGATNFQNS